MSFPLPQKYTPAALSFQSHTLIEGVKLATALIQRTRSAIHKVVGVSTSSTPRFRVISFNTHCFEGNFSTNPVVPDDIPLLTEDVTVEVFLEVDDGVDGPTSPAILVLSGTDPIL